MERLWNIIHYFVHKLDHRFQLAIDKIVIYFIKFRMNSQKKALAEKGIDVYIDNNADNRRPDSGKSSFRTDIFMFLITLMFFSNFLAINSAITKRLIDVHIVIFFVFIAFSFLINYLFLYKQAKYLYYFTKFERLKEEERKKRARAVYITLICFLLFSTACYIFMSHNLE